MAQPPTPSPAPVLRRPWLKWAAAGVFAWWMVLGALSAVQLTLLRDWNKLPFSMGLVLTVAAYDTVTWTPLSIAAFWLAHRLPLENGGWRRSLLLLVAAAVSLVFLKSVMDFNAYKHWEFYIGTPPTFTEVVVTRLPRHFMMFSLLVGIGYGVDYFVRFRDRQIAAARLETELARAHLHALETQLQPHFLFNTLHAIATLLHVDPPAAERMLTSLSELLRASLAAQPRQEVPLADELELLRAYVDIEQVRFGDRLRVDLDVAPDARPAHVPHLLLQPLVENAVRHGISPKKHGGRVTVAAHRDGDRLRIRVQDDGRGFCPGERREGIGLANTRARLQQMYRDGQSLALASTPGEGTTIDIALPYHTSGGGAR